MGVVKAYQTANPAEGLSAVTGKDEDRLNLRFQRYVMLSSPILTFMMVKANP